jgi:hypothetical protein
VSHHEFWDEGVFWTGDGRNDFLVRSLKRNLICSQNSEKTDCDSRGGRRWVDCWQLWIEFTFTSITERSPYFGKMSFYRYA